MIKPVGFKGSQQTEGEAALFYIEQTGSACCDCWGHEIGGALFIVEQKWFHP